MPPDVPDVPPVVAVPELVAGLTPPVVAPLPAAADELLEGALAGAPELGDALVADGEEELVVAVVLVDDAAL